MDLMLKSSPTIPMIVNKSSLLGFLLRNPESFGKTDSSYNISSYSSYSDLKDTILSKGMVYLGLMSPFGYLKATISFLSFMNFTIALLLEPSLL